MRAKKLLSSRQIFRYAVPARTVTKKALLPGHKKIDAVGWVRQCTSQSAPQTAGVGGLGLGLE